MTREELIQYVDDNVLDVVVDVAMTVDDIREAIRLEQELVQPEAAGAGKPAGQEAGQPLEQTPEQSKEQVKETDGQATQPPEKTAGDDLDGMTREELIQYVDDNLLDVVVDDSMTADDMREAIRLELELLKDSEDDEKSKKNQ